MDLFMDFSFPDNKRAMKNVTGLEHNCELSVLNYPTPENQNNFIPTFTLEMFTMASKNVGSSPAIHSRRQDAASTDRG